MNRWIAMIAAVAACLWPLPSALAQQTQALQQTAAPRQTARQALSQQAVKREPVELIVGQKIADAETVLRQHGKEAGFGKAFATVGGPADSEDLSFYLDEKRIFVALHFHKTTQQVYGITACFIPDPNPGRLYHTHFSAHKITLHPDGSYNIHFEKPSPPRPKPAAERPTRKIPTADGFREEPVFGGNGQVPANPNSR